MRTHCGISVLSRYPLISNTNFCFLKHIYPLSSMLFHLKRLFRFIDIHHRSTLSSNSCTYTPCSVCAHINMYDEIFIHIHPKIDIYPFRSRLSSKHRLCAQLCIYVLDLARTHIPTSNYLFSHQALFALHTHYS